MNDRHVRIRVWAGTLIALIVLVRLLSACLMPWGQTVKHHLEGLNDEPAHFNYVKYLAEHKKFPVLEHFVLEPDAFTRNEFEYHHAPLYYLICAPFYAFFGEKGGIAAGRFISMIAGLLTLWVLALFLRDLGCSYRVQLAAVAFAGLLPSHLYFSSFVSNDSLSWLLAILFIRELVRIVMISRMALRQSFFAPSLRAALWLAAGLLTKSSVALFLPLPALLSGWLFYKHRDTRVIWSGLSIVAAAILVALPWYIRNFALYHTFSGIPPSTIGIPVTLPSTIGLVKGTIKYFWFPMQNLRGGTLPFLLLTAAGTVILLCHAAVAAWWLIRKIINRAMTLEIFLMAGLFCLVAAVHAWYYFEWLNPEARFLFPALGPLAALMILPVSEIFAMLRIRRLLIPYIVIIAFFPYPFIFFTS
jgi:hypothetical protein